MRQRTLSDGTPIGVLALGSVPFGTTVDEATSFAILDRFAAAGGTAIDTANNYAYWVEGATGDEAETVIGRWLASRGARDDVVISTKAGARPGARGYEGLSAPVIRTAMEDSLRRLGIDHVDVYWAHVEDRSVPMEETAGALGDLVAQGKTRLLGASNHAVWRVERARRIASPSYTCLQYRFSYVQPRAGVPLPEGGHVHASAEVLDYAATEPGLTLWAYTALLMGAYTRADKRLPAAYDHPGTPRRLAAVREVAASLGATPHQVVLAWLLDHEVPIIPIVGVSSVAQLDELLGATDIKLDAATRAHLDSID